METEFKSRQKARLGSTSHLVFLTLIPLKALKA